jgi:hypothetical protein
VPASGLLAGNGAGADSRAGPPLHAAPGKHGFAVQICESLGDMTSFKMRREPRPCPACGTRGEVVYDLRGQWPTASTFVCPNRASHTRLTEEQLHSLDEVGRTDGGQIIYRGMPEQSPDASADEQSEQESSEQDPPAPAGGDE